MAEKGVRADRWTSRANRVANGPGETRFDLGRARAGAAQLR